MTCFELKFYGNQQCPTLLKPSPRRQEAESSGQQQGETCCVLRKFPLRPPRLRGKPSEKGLGSPARTIRRGTFFLPRRL